MSVKFTKLSDSSWELIEKLAQFKLPAQRGVVRTDLRKIWNSILYILITGQRWCDLPVCEDYATRATAHRWLIRWQEEGVFDRVLSGLLQKAIKEGKANLSHLAIDGTFSPESGRRKPGRIRTQRKGCSHSSFD